MKEEDKEEGKVGNVGGKDDEDEEDEAWAMAAINAEGAFPFRKCSDETIPLARQPVSRIEEKSQAARKTKSKHPSHSQWHSHSHTNLEVEVSCRRIPIDAVEGGNA